MNTDAEHYIVVTEFDVTPHHIERFGGEPRGPLVHETYLGEHSTREAAEKRAEQLKRYGRCRIARLVFEPTK